MAATVTEVTLGGSPMSAGIRFNLLSVTAASGNGVSSFTALHGAFQANSNIIAITPTNAAALDIGQMTPSMSDGTLTLTLPAAKDFDGTENWTISVQSQV